MKSFNFYKDLYKNLDKDKSHFLSSNDEPTPLSLVEEMYSFLPDEFFQRKNIKILDPCCGNGNFFIVLYFLLLKNNFLENQILEDIFVFNEINQERIKNIYEIFGNTIKIDKEDYLTKQYKEKFDLIVANPPYAKITNGKRTSKNHTLVRDFLKKSLDDTKDDGYILYLIPNNWMSLADRNQIIQEITKYTFIHLDLGTSKKYFPKIGSSFTWFIVKKTKNNNEKFTVQNKFGKFQNIESVRNKNREYIPLYINEITDSIFEKTIDKDNRKFPIETTSFLHAYTKKHFLSLEETEMFRYKQIHTKNQNRFSKIPHKFQDGYKVFITTTDKYDVFIDDCGMTQSIAFIRCKDENDAMKRKQILQHPLYKFLNNLCRWGNFNNIRILQKFPDPGDISYDEVFTYFSITKEEQDFINKMNK